MAIPLTGHWSRFAGTVLGLPLLLAHPAAACAPDDHGSARYYRAELDGAAGFHQAFAPLTRLAELAPQDGASVAQFRRVAAGAEGPARFLALWALARLVPDDPLIRAAIDEASGRAGSRNVFELATAAAFLARAGVDAAEVDRFLPPLYNRVRELEDRDGSLFRRAVLTWALYEIGAPVTMDMADGVLQGFIDRPFAGRTLLTGIDVFETIRPHARAAVPLLTDIVRGEHDLSTYPYREDAARALMVIGGPQAHKVFADFIDALRRDLTGGPSPIGRIAGVVLGVPEDQSLAARIGEAREMLPYSRCLTPVIAAILDDSAHGDAVYLEAADFLIGAGAPKTGAMRRRLDDIIGGGADPRMRERAGRLREGL